MDLATRSAHSKHRSGEDIAIFAVGTAFFVLTTPVVAARLFLASRFKSWGYDDRVIFFCQLAFMARVILEAVSIFGFGSSDHREQLSAAQASKISHIYFVSNILNIVAIIALKLSIGLLLLRYTASRLISRWTLYLTTGAVVGFSIANGVVFAFQCNPTSLWWSTEAVPATKCLSPSLVASLEYSAASLNMAADMIFMLVAAYLVCTIDMTVQARALLCPLLVLGSLTIPAAAVQIPYSASLHPLRDVHHGFIPETSPRIIAITVEIGLGIIASSGMSFAPLFQRCIGGENEGNKADLAMIQAASDKFYGGPSCQENMQRERLRSIPDGTGLGLSGVSSKLDRTRSVSSEANLLRELDVQMVVPNAIVHKDKHGRRARRFIPVKTPWWLFHRAMVEEFPHVLPISEHEISGEKFRRQQEREENDRKVQRGER